MLSRGSCSDCPTSWTRPRAVRPLCSLGISSRAPRVSSSASPRCSLQSWSSTHLTTWPGLPHQATSLGTWALIRCQPYRPARSTLLALTLTLSQSPYSSLAHLLPHATTSRLTWAYCVCFLSFIPPTLSLAPGRGVCSFIRSWACARRGPTCPRLRSRTEGSPCWRWLALASKKLCMVPQSYSRRRNTSLPPSLSDLTGVMHVGRVIAIW